jgi:hypothetical protein
VEGLEPGVYHTDGKCQDAPQALNFGPPNAASYSIHPMAAKARILHNTVHSDVSAAASATKSDGIQSRRSGFVLGVVVHLTTL